jgi:hypothetical protein
MTKKIVFGVAAVALAVLVMAPSASASCIPGKSATTYGAALTYWHVPVQGTLTGQTWQLGAPGSWSTGNCNTVDSGNGFPGFLYFSAGGINLHLDLGACGAGCPGPVGANTLAVLAMNRTPAGTDFLLDTVAETPLAANNYDYSTQGDHGLIPIPRPRVLASSRVGSSVNLNVGIDSISAGLIGPGAATAVTGFNLLSAPSTADPGRDSGAYSPRASVPSSGGNAATSQISVDCTDITKDQFLVVQIVLENGTVLSSSVGGATRINCNPTMANPKYKVVTPTKKGGQIHN